MSAFPDRRDHSAPAHAKTSATAHPTTTAKPSVAPPRETAPVKAQTTSTPPAGANAVATQTAAPETASPGRALQLPAQIVNAVRQAWRKWVNVDAARRRAQDTVGAVRCWYGRHQRACMLCGAVVSGFVALKSSLLVTQLVRRARANAFFRGLERDMVHLFVHPRWTHGPNPFPNCVYVEAFLRLARIPYVVHFTNDSTLSPSGRLPFIVHNGTKLAEPELIVEYLTAQYHVTMNQYLTKDGHIKGNGARRLAETSLSYGLSRATFVDHPDFMIDVFAKEYSLQPIVAGIIVRSMRSATIRQLNSNGHGDLSQSLYESMFQRDVEALETMLRDNGHYIGGRLPSSYDCSVFAWLQVAVELGDSGNATLAYVKNSEVFREYIQRMARQTFPDMDKLVTAETMQRFIPISTPRTPRQSQSRHDSQPRQESPSTHKHA